MRFLGSKILPCALILPALSSSFAQIASSPASTKIVNTSSAPSAFVYVNGFASPTSSRIYGFSAASNGTLTPLPGSPFASPVASIALNGKWLFGTYADAQGKNTALYSYSIAANGSLKQADFLNTFNVPSYETLANLTLDHSGNSVYAGFADGTGDNGYEAFSINQTNGKLTNLNVSYTGVGAYAPISFIDNNQYAYGANCYHFSPEIYGFARMSSGDLSQVGMNVPLPTPPPNTGFCPGSAVAADPYNDVVIPLFQYATASNNPGNPQLAVYTADKYGKLSTTSTYQSMPTPLVEPDFLAMSPAGYYLAVTGANQGLQIFLMHGSKAPTALTGAVLPGAYLNQAFWDNNQHLYVLGLNKLYVFTVSTKGVTQVPGSPFAVPSASGLSVLPK